MNPGALRLFRQFNIVQNYVAATVSFFMYTGLTSSLSVHASSAIKSYAKDTT